MSGEELIDKLARNPVARLRWRVCREFRILPFSKEAQRMTDRQVVFCGAQMVLDRRERDGARGDEGTLNGGFDEARFAQLAGGSK